MHEHKRCRFDPWVGKIPWRRAWKPISVLLPGEIWTEVHDIVQEAVYKTIPKKKKCQKAKWLSEEALQIFETKREAKGKGEKERYKHLNAEFQRIARGDKKPFSVINAKK